MDIPASLSPEDELTHQTTGEALWSENYLTQAYDPDAGVGVYFHLCHMPAENGMWEQEFVIYLPDDHFLVANGVSPGSTEEGVIAGNVSFRCDKPYEQWTKRFIGGARLVTGEELRAGPLRDGAHVPVEFEIQTTAFGPPVVFHDMPEQPWGKGHYEQHHDITATLRYGTEELRLRGTGLRDHSWGVRDYALIGNTVWLHGQFPDSGRNFTVVHVPGVPPAEPFTFATLGDRDGIETAQLINDPPVAMSVEQAERGGYTLELKSASRSATISAEILAPMRMAFRGPSGISMGFHRGPDINHDYVEAQSRYTCDGEIGYGLTERSVQLFGI